MLGRTGGLDSNQRLLSGFILFERVLCSSAKKHSLEWFFPAFGSKPLPYEVSFELRFRSSKAGVNRSGVLR